MTTGIIHKAVFDRAAADSALDTEVGQLDGELKLFSSRPATLAEWTSYPILVMLGPLGASQNGAVAEGLIGMEVFVEPQTQGYSKLRAIETALFALFHRQWWTVAGVRYWATISDADERPREDGEPILWRYDIEVSASS